MTSNSSLSSARHDPIRLAVHKTRESLDGMLGREEGHRVWRDACRSAGLAADAEPTTLEMLEQIAEHLSARSGMVSLAGNSLAIRVRTYGMLERNQLLEKFLSTQDILDGRPGKDSAS